MPQYQGVWSLQQQMQALTSGQWATDPNFKNTTLLLQADNAANSAQNNTFLDSSTNAFAITRNGNTTQGTFTPFSATGWSNFFDGTGDYLTISDSASLELGSSDFCLECFVNFSVLPPSNGNTATFLSKWAAAPNASYLYYLYNDNGTQKLYFTYTTNGTTPVNVGGIAWAPSIGVWYHVAVTRSGSNLRFFVNGVQAGATQTLSATVSDTTANTAVGGFQTTGDMNGYISNARIVIGSPVYTADFAPSTLPLTAITNTRLLTCQNNRFVDNSTNAFSIVLNGNTSVQAFSPFAPQFQYTASGTGGSGYFDGTGDELSIAANTAFQFGTGDFTIEGWIYTDSSTELYGKRIVSKYASAGNGGWLLEVLRTSGNTVRFMWYNSTPTLVVDLGTNDALAANAWHHIAVSRSGANVSLFVDGARKATSASVSGATDNYSTTVYVGSGGAVDTYTDGYLSNVRLVKGTAVYDPTLTTLTVPTAPLTAITNTSLLLNFTNAGILDGTMKNNLETVGGASVSTSVVKYGSGSMYFDGTGDYLSGRMIPDLVFGSGDMTIEAWIYPNTISGTDTIYDTRTAASYGTNAFSFQLESGIPKVYAGSAVGELLLSGTTAVPTGAWTHVAFTRSGSINRLFVNGVQQASGTTAWNQTFTSTNVFLVGETVVGGAVSTRPFDGYMDDFRITKGIARYTQNFIPPSVALPRQ